MKPVEAKSPGIEMLGELSAENAALVKRLGHPSALDEIMDAARAEGGELVLKIMSGPHRGEVYVVGFGYRRMMASDGERIA